jgi:hypothetical protein
VTAVIVRARDVRPLTDEAGAVVVTDPLAITPEFRDTARQLPACTVN